APYIVCTEVVMTPRATGTSRVSLREYDHHADWTPFLTAVSLHSHTSHSREIMADLPGYIAQIPLLNVYFERELQSKEAREGSPADFTKGWWRPPVSPRGVFDSEATQIDSRFGLHSIVSVTDHDNIQSGLDLQQLYASGRAPIAFEWSVPYGEGFFHLGV